MRILMVGTGVFPVPSPMGGGTENHVYYLTNALAELGHEVHLVSDVPKGAHFHDNVIIHPVNAPPVSINAGFAGWMRNHLLGGISVVKTMASRLLNQIDSFDIIHLHGRLGSLLSAVLIKNILRLKKALIYTIHDTPPWYCSYESVFERIVRYVAYRAMELRVAKLADAIIAVNKMIAKTLTAEHGVPNSKVHIIPSGVDTDLFRPSSHKEKFCLFVGHLIKRKGVKYLLRALKILNDSVKCIIVGDGPEKNALRSKAKKLGLTNVSFVGSISTRKLIELYSKAAVFILSSLSEGTPVSILEAMSCGCPVIAFSVGGIPEIIRNGINGFLIKPGDVRALANCIEVLINDSSLLRKLGENARSMMKKMYDWKVIAKKTYSLYKCILKSYGLRFRKEG